jgi:hypothetical protein
MGSGIATHDKMVLVGIEELVVLLARFVESCNQVHGILEMYIVIGRAVNE